MKSWPGEIVLAVIDNLVGPTVMLNLLLWPVRVVLEVITHSERGTYFLSADRNLVFQHEPPRPIFFRPTPSWLSPRRSTSLYLPEAELVNYVYGRQGEKATKKSDCGPVHSPMKSHGNENINNTQTKKHSKNQQQKQKKTTPQTTLQDQWRLLDFPSQALKRKPTRTELATLLLPKQLMREAADAEAESQAIFVLDTMWLILLKGNSKL